MVSGFSFCHYLYYVVVIVNKLNYLYVKLVFIICYTILYLLGSGSGAFSGGAANTSGFGQSAFGKPAVPAVFGQANTSLFNQTTQPNTGLFGSTAATPAFGQTPTAQPAFGGW